MENPFIYEISGMTDKQLTAQGRKMRLFHWLRRRKLSGKFNLDLEAAESFAQKLDAWANDSNPHTLAPSFHYFPGI